MIEPQKLDPTKIIEKVALKYLETPYLWGGRTPFGIDCSGFTQMVFRLAGIQLKRDASQQADQGINVDFRHLAKMGDLAFFSKPDGQKITHVGIVFGEDQVIHASGKVKIDTLDHYGIVDSSQKKYSHRLKFIKRLI